MRPRLFLRTAEFLWQEGHTAHETEAEAARRPRRCCASTKRLRASISRCRSSPVRRAEGERFPGAVQTLCIEAMVQDRKAIQAGTSHFLGQNFAKASGIQFLSREGKQEFAWTTSWGVSTRLIGTVIMAHGDDDGLVLPPRIAPTHIVILPVTPKPETRAAVLERSTRTCAATARHHLARRTARGGGRSARHRRRHEELGMDQERRPLRVEIGPRDLERGQVAVSRRDGLAEVESADPGEQTSKSFLPSPEFVRCVSDLLESIQQTLYDRALAFRDENTRVIDTKEEFYDFFTPKDAEKPEIHGGFALAHWNGGRAVEEQIKNDLKVTIRCIPFDDPANPADRESGVHRRAKSASRPSGQSLCSLSGPFGRLPGLQVTRGCCRPSGRGPSDRDSVRATSPPRSSGPEPRRQPPASRRRINPGPGESHLQVKILPRP